MKKLALIFITLSLLCQAFTKPLCEEEPKFLWYRQIYLQGCVYRLNDLKQVCDQHGWDDHSSLEMQEIINSMKFNLCFPE